MFARIISKHTWRKNSHRKCGIVSGCDPGSQFHNFRDVGKPICVCENGIRFQNGNHHFGYWKMQTRQCKPWKTLTRKKCIWLEMIRWTAQIFATQLLHHVIAKLATNCVQNVAQKRWFLWTTQLESNSVVWHRPFHRSSCPKGLSKMQTVGTELQFQIVFSRKPTIFSIVFQFVANKQIIGVYMWSAQEQL